MNDERYGMVELGHMALYGRSPSYPCHEMRIDDLARGMGAEAIVVEKADEILQAELLSRTEHGPVVLDIRIDRTVQMPKDKRTQQLGKSMGVQIPE